MSNADNITALPTPTPETSAPAAPKQPIQLTTEVAVELSGALVRLDEIRATAIITKELSEEQSLLGEYVASKLVLHARDLLACYFIMNNEYRPLVIALSPIVNRCVDMRRQAVAQDEAK